MPETVDPQAEEPFHQLMAHIGRLTNDQLVVLIDQAWEEYRTRQGFSLEDPRRQEGKGRGS